jgi:hypothetical protein
MPGIQFDYGPDDASRARIAANAERGPRELYLGPRAEAFASQIARDRANAGPTFEDWKRANAPRQRLALAVRLFSFVPGLIAFVLHASPALAIALEVAAVAGNIWVRRERFRRVREIANWEDPAAKTDGFVAGRISLLPSAAPASPPAAFRRR